MPDMKAVVLDKWGGDLSVETVPVPKPGKDELLVNVRACGVTRTIENVIQGGLSDDPTLTPRIPGHEFSGVVEEVGNDVKGIEEGDRVVAYFYMTCGECDACRSGRDAQCTNFGGWLGVHTDGAYAEKAVIPASNALPLPDIATFEEGAIGADRLATPLHVCRRADITDEDTVVIIGGAGAVGIHLAQAARMNGATVLAADIHEERLKHIEDTTDPHVYPVDATQNDFTQRLEELTPYGDGPTVVVDTVGNMETLRDAWEAMTMGGRVVSLTTHHDHVFDAPLKEYVQKEASLLGSRYATKQEVIRATRMLADGRVIPVSTQTVSLDEVPEVHERIRSGETHGFTVLEP
ncbi:MAG: alcohol dehydrogenase catalytic domain-containing protein [Halobacteria archaeon]|nr:alcohol dehydrogenase catalytic domain-containing protein [Halobacteria archaeon]